MSLLVTLPITDPVLIFALAMVIFLIAPLIFERMRLPGMIGLIIAGALVGPNAFGLLARGNTIVLLGTVGLLYLMFMVGLELDLNEFNRHRKHSVIFGFLSFALPQAIGTALSLMLGYSLPSALLLGAMFASHTLLAFPIASRLGILKSGAVTTVLGATLLTDFLALLVLAIVTGTQGDTTGAGFWIQFAVSLVIYTFLVLWGLPKVARWFFRRLGSDGISEFVFTLAIAFVSYAMNLNIGGTLGGISSGQDILVSLALKPTSSIAIPGKTVDKAGQRSEIVTTGRHDPCVGLRAVPIAEAMVALVLMDHYLRHRGQNADVASGTPVIPGK